MVDEPVLLKELSQVTFNENDKSIFYPEEVVYIGLH